MRFYLFWEGKRGSLAVDCATDNEHLSAKLSGMTMDELRTLHIVEGGKLSTTQFMVTTSDGTRISLDV